MVRNETDPILCLATISAVIFPASAAQRSADPLVDAKATAVRTQTHPLSFALNWRRAADLPDPIGLKGMYAGVSGKHVVLAGGSNFPVPLRAGGRKVFHRA